MKDHGSSACDRAMEALLEAELDELDRGGPSALARHLEGCRECRRAAEVVVRRTQELDRWLSRPGAGVDLEALRRRAGLEVVEGEGAARERGTAAGGRMRGARWALPLTAAAALAALFFMEGGRRTPSPRPTEVAPGVAAAPTEGPDLGLEVPGTRTAAVFETDDPDITVIWLFDEKGGDP